MACKADVLRLHRKGLPSGEIAALLECHAGYVRATLSRAGLTRSGREHRAAQIEKRLSAISREQKALTLELKQLHHRMLHGEN